MTPTRRPQPDMVRLRPITSDDLPHLAPGTRLYLRVDHARQITYDPAEVTSTRQVRTVYATEVALDTDIWDEGLFVEDEADGQSVPITRTWGTAVSVRLYVPDQFEYETETLVSEILRDGLPEGTWQAHLTVQQVADRRCNLYDDTRPDGEERLTLVNVLEAEAQHRGGRIEPIPADAQVVTP